MAILNGSGIGILDKIYGPFVYSLSLIISFSFLPLFFSPLPNISIAQQLTVPLCWHSTYEQQETISCSKKHPSKI